MKEHSLSKTNSKTHKKIINYLFISILLLQFSKISCDNICSSETDLTDTSCFNNVIYFNHYNYRSGHFAVKKNNDLVIEYSGDPPSCMRLLYGLKSNGGRGLFNDGYIKEKNLTTSNDGRYEARNIFVSLKGDTSKSNEYLFSTSSHKTITELHDLENDSFKTLYSDDFNSKRIFSFVYSLLHTTINNNNYYFLIFTSPNNDNNPDASDGTLVVIRKFAFNAFDLTNIESSTTTFTQFGSRVISGFLMEEDQAIVILYLKRSTDNNNVAYAQYNIKFFNYNLQQIGNDINNYVDTIKHQNGIVENWGIYSNCIYLKDRIGLFIYFHGSKLIFQCFKFNLNNDTRIAVVTTQSSGTKICFILLDFYGSYSNVKFRIYYYNVFSDKELNKELAVFSYNKEFLVVTSTMSPINTDGTFTSFLLFFSYPNGTDFEIDISPYIQNSNNYDSTKNLFSFLMGKMKIENNIFRYKKVQKIKLVSIPEEIIFYDSNDLNTPLQNGSYLLTNYILQQNTELKKTYQLYYLYYQYIAKEPTYNDLYYSGLDIQHKDGVTNADFSGSYSAKEVEGRINKLSFKLCHDYCESCYILSKDDDHQNCTTCLEINTYDYLAYINQFTGNCVPQGKMYDKEEEKLKTCDGNEHKYYYNTSRDGEKYCFKYNYTCPDTYPYLNITSNECINYTEPIPTTIITTIPKIPTTIPKIPTTIITTIPKIPTTIPKIPTTIITTIPKIPTTIPKIPTTIITTIPKIPTTIPKIPTTIITTIPIKPPTTIITTIPKVPTTIPKIPTTIITTIPNVPTTIPKIPTTIIIPPTTIITTIPQIKETTIITVIPTTIINCNYYTIYTQRIFDGLSDEGIFNKLEQDIVSTYPLNGSSVIVNGSNNYAFQLTNTENEKNDFNNGKQNSIIDLGKCEETLRGIYQINNSFLITILKYYNLESNDKEINFELYHPINHSKLNLSYCEDGSYDVYIHLDLEESLISKYINAKKQGVDLFNSEDSFYKKICT